MLPLSLVANASALSLRERCSVEHYNADFRRILMQQRWLILAVLTFSRTVMGFQFQSVAASSSLLIEHFQLSYAALGILIGLYLFPGVAVAIPGGLLAQRFGDKQLLLSGLAAMATGGALMALSDNTAALMAGRVLSGTGGVIVNVITTKMLTDWFAGAEIATAFGFFMISWPLGIAAALVILPLLNDATSSHSAMFLPAMLSMIALLLVSLLYRAPDWAASQPRGTLAFNLTRREVYMISVAGLLWTFYNGAFVIVPAFGPAFAAASGINPAAASAIVSSMTWCVILVVPLSAWFAAKIGRANLAMYTSFACAAVALALLAMLGPSLPLFAVIGIALAPPGGLIMTLPSEALRPEHRASGMGVYLAWYYAGMGVLPAMAGWAGDLTGSAAAPFWFAIVLLGIAAAALIHFRVCKEDGRKLSSSTSQFIDLRIAH
jgi:MFS family permease